MFPSLVNCCTIDWFTEWPEEALRSVANHFLHGVEMSDEVKAGVLDVCVDMQSRVSKMAGEYLESLGRYYYVTPTSYLELINTFQSLISKQRDTVMLKKTRYANGLEKLISTEEQVDTMKAELIALQPKLAEATVATNEKLVKVKEAQVIANEKKTIVDGEAAICAEQEASATAMKTDCEAELAIALPALDAALKALKTLSKADITEVKNFKKPPGGVIITMEAVCIMLEKKPNKIANPNGKGKVNDYWTVAKKELLGDPKFLQILLAFDKDNIDAAIVEKVKKYTERDDFTPEIVKKASIAASGLCKWIHAMVTYDRVAKVVAPKTAALAIATSDLAAAQEALAGKKAELQILLDKLQALETELKDTQDKKEELERNVEDCKNKLDRATRLIDGLGGEKKRWSQFVTDLQKQYDNVTGDILIASGTVAYLGAFTAGFRADATKQWIKKLTELNITCDQAFQLSKTLGEPVTIREWTINKLPSDSFSIENAIMLSVSNRWPLMIDPQGQANKWVRNTYAVEEGEESILFVCKQNQATFVRTIENAIQFGKIVLLENVPENIDPVLESVLLKQIVNQGGIKVIQVGDNMVGYDERFKLFITTKLRNPHYPPETCVKVNLLNFMATMEGLEDQMLGITVKEERPDLEAQREQLVLDDARNKKQLKAIEDEILKLLAESTGNILDDENLINTLGESKVKGDEIEVAVKAAEKTQKLIDDVREGYQPVAYRVATLFFCIADLALVDPMYQYSLEWYIGLFLLAIKKATASPVLETRIDNLCDTFTSVLYRNVCRSLFETHKLLFSFLLCSKIMLGSKTMDQQELRFLLQGNTAVDLAEPNPTVGTSAKWLSDKTWGDLLGVASLPNFTAVVENVKTHLPVWEQIYNDVSPIDKIAQASEDFGFAWNLFQQICVLRCIRPDKVVPCIQDFVAEEMGKSFIDPPSFDLGACYADSNCCSPLLFVLTSGADPMTELIKFADSQNMGGNKLFSISLGQGQGPIAEEGIKKAIDHGTWVCLQNVHLSESWMPALEKICEDITPERTHGSFRMWLTSMPSPKFPVYVLQNGVKMTLEPPKGVRANLLGSYGSFDSSLFEDICSKPTVYKKLFFGICFFHAIVRERCKFGPLGWNIPYTFSLPDLRITADQLPIFIDTYEEIPFKLLVYMTGQCNYGGRVTDDKDRRCIMNIISDYYCKEILDPAYKFSTSGTYYAPKNGSFESHMEYIRQLPFHETPEVFGMHDNANITCAMQETNALLATALSLQPKSSGGGDGMTWEEQLEELAKDISGRLPDLYDVEKAEAMYPVKFEESMNTVLTQELMRFNKLLSRMKDTMINVCLAIKGEVVMSEDLETLGNQMVMGRVPTLWSSVAYPSLKPLGSWVTDLLQRLQFFQDWIDNDTPALYWISGFFFCPSFLTGTRQNVARKYTIPIDILEFDFQVMTPAETEAITKKPEDGAYIIGLFLEGANFVDNMVEESRPKELYVSMPAIWLIPKKTDEITSRHTYHCPIYKTSERRGMLSTTGHSTNYVMSVHIDMRPQDVEKHWIKRGVAMLTQLDD
jgi:dynein heavy chain